MNNNIPIILLSGMAADARLFAAQAAAFPQLIAPDWIEPKNRESMASYAARMAEIVDPGCDCVIGGASFGGIVALEMARHLHLKACLLLCSVRSPREFPWWASAVRPLHHLGPDRLGSLAGLIGQYSGSLSSRAQRRALTKLSHEEHRFLRWASWAVLRWKPSSAPPGFPIFQIHGSEDRTFPAHRSRADTIVPGAGHLLPVTHAEFVNDFIRQKLQRLAS